MGLYVECNKLLPKALDGDKKAIKSMAKLLGVSSSLLSASLKITNYKINLEAKLTNKTRKQVIEENICQDRFTL